ncbi:MAG: CRTAC1 family protein [Gemmataceae bacterium]
MTEQAGVRFKHVCGAAGKKLLPETMGSGVAVLDFDRDGKPDLFFVNSRPWPGNPAAGRAVSALYRNKGDGTFEDVTAAVGLDVELYGLGAAVADYDNDGFPDLFVTAVGGNKLFRNDGGKKFVDVTAAAGVGGGGGLPTGDILRWDRPVSFPSSATWLDFDGDGRLDLFVCNYLTWAPAVDLHINAVLPGGRRAYVPPTQFPGTHCQLYHNLGDGRFADVSSVAGVEVTEPTGPGGGMQPAAKALGVVACDPDRDGWPDLVVANDTVRNFFFQNVPDGKGGRRFEEVGLTANVAYADGRPRGGMGVDSCELLPGRLAVVVANFTNEPNTLLTLTRPSPLLFHDTAPADGLAGPSRGPMKFGAAFLDYDLDGRPDLLTVNGHLEPDIALARPGQTHPQPAQLFRNTGKADGGLFETIGPEAAGPDLFAPMVGRGLAVFDYDGDGHPDLAITANDGPARLLRSANDTGHRWLRLALEGDGVRSNRDAIGAEVEVVAGGVTRRFYVTGSRGYLSSSELAVTVGLGQSEAADRVTVRWPGAAGGSQTWERLAAGKTHVLKQDR